MLLVPLSSPRILKEELEQGSPKIPEEGGQELVHWFLGKSYIMATFCCNLLEMLFKIRLCLSAGGEWSLKET